MGHLKLACFIFFASSLQSMAGSTDENGINNKTETEDYKSQELPTITSSYNMRRMI